MSDSLVMQAACSAWSARRGTSRALALALLTLGATGCEWFTDFKRQPSVVTWESLRAESTFVRGAPQGSVPTTGTFMASFAVSYTPSIAAIDSLAGIANPTPISEASLANGRMYYQINCAVCHGETGQGDGMATKFGMVPMTFMSDVMKTQRSDGYIYGMIRNGRGLMPSYNRIEEMDRWDVVNYIRALQGKVTGMTIGTGPLAPPGVTGDMLPGRTRFGPTRAVPAAPAAMSRTTPGAPTQGSPVTPPAPARRDSSSAAPAKPGEST
jgi:mono/diheme cytochrome c family protein